LASIISTFIENTYKLSQLLSTENAFWYCFFGVLFALVGFSLPFSSHFPNSVHGPVHTDPSTRVYTYIYIFLFGKNKHELRIPIPIRMQNLGADVGHKLDCVGRLETMTY